MEPNRTTRACPLSGQRPPGLPRLLRPPPDTAERARSVYTFSPRCRKQQQQLAATVKLTESPVTVLGLQVKGRTGGGGKRILRCETSLHVRPGRRASALSRGRATEAERGLAADSDPGRRVHTPPPLPLRPWAITGQTHKDHLSLGPLRMYGCLPVRHFNVAACRVQRPAILFDRRLIGGMKVDH